MNKNIFKQVTIAMMMIVCTTAVKAQVTIGSEAEPHEDAVLELKTAHKDKGLLLPRVALKATNLPAPLANHVEGMTVYNTATDGNLGFNVDPGVYHNDGTQWVAVHQESITPTTTVFVDTTDPNSATVFSEEAPIDEDGNTNPNFIHDASLTKTPDCLYICTNGNSWIWDGTKYITFTQPDVTPFYLGSSSALDAAGNKIDMIWRQGHIGIGAATNPRIALYARTPKTPILKDVFWGGYFYSSMPQITDNASRQIGLTSAVKPQISKGVTNTGIYMGIETTATRSLSEDQGTANTLIALRAAYGNSGVTATTREATGITLLPQAQSGSIQEIYDIYVSPGGIKSGVITGQHYGLYISGNADDKKINYLGGSLGLGTTGTGAYRLYVKGNAYVSGTLTHTSDIRLKTDIVNTSLGLDALMKLRPVEYTLNIPEERDDEGNLISKGTSESAIGFIAQEVEPVVPLAVTAPQSEEEYYGMKYSALIPVLTKAIQEQQAQIEALKKEIEELKK